MALDVQQVDIPLSKGLAQQIDARLVPPGGLLTARNVCYSQHGALTKRPGYESMATAIVGSGAFPPPQKLCVLGGELLAIGTRTAASGGLPEVFSYSPALAKWTDRDDACACSVTREPAHRSALSQETPFVTYTNGLLVYWWTVGPTGIFMRAVDATTGAVVQDDIQQVVASGTVVSAFTVGTLSVLLYTQPGTGFLRALAWSAVSLTLNTYVIDGTVCERFDAGPIEGDTSHFCVAWTRTAGRGDLLVAIIETAGFTTTSLVTKVTGGALDALCIAGNGGGKIFVGYYDSSLSKVRALAYNDVALGTGTATVDIGTGITTVRNLGAGISSTGGALYAFDGANVASEPVLVRRSVTTACVLTGPLGYLLSVSLVSRPFRAPSGRMYAVLGISSGGATHLLALVDDEGDAAGILLAGVLARSVASVPTNVGFAPTQFVVSTTGARYVTATRVLTVANSLSQAFGTDLTTLDFATQQPRLWNDAQAQRCVYLTGGITTCFDGMAAVETGFVQAPSIVSTTQSVGAGTIANGSYLYVATFEWTDSCGNIHYSAVSDPKTMVVTGANNTVTIRVATLGMTARGQLLDGAAKDVRIHLFRTLAGQGAPFYRTTSRVAGVGASSYIVNDKSAFSVTHVDIDSDTALKSLGFGFLYTDGGILESQCAPPSRAVVSHKNRLWLASGEDGKRVYFSKTFTPAEAPGFNEILSLRCDDSPDDVTALASLDDLLIVFTASRIYAVAGDGPNDTGDPASGGFTTPALISANTGCLDPRSVVSFAGGVFFQSAEGLTLLGRDRSVTFAGASVLGTLHGSPTFLGATHDPASRRILWLVSQPNVIPFFLVYDYGYDVWTTWHHTGLVGAAPVATTYWSGAHVYANNVTALRQAYGNTKGHDDGVFPVSTTGLAWMRLGAFSGYQRVRRVTLQLNVLTDCVLTVNIYTDFSDTAAQTATIDTSTLARDGSAMARAGIHLNAAAQTCSALRITITDAAGASTSSRDPAGVSLAGVTLEVGMKRGSAKLPATNRS